MLHFVNLETKLSNTAVSKVVIHLCISPLIKPMSLFIAEETTHSQHGKSSLNFDRKCL